jgi:hypothetical protein
LVITADDSAVGTSVLDDSTNPDIRSLFESNNEEALALTEAVFRKCILQKMQVPNHKYLLKKHIFLDNFLSISDSMAISISFHIIINRAIADCQIIGYDRLVGIDLLILRTGTIGLFEGNF